MCLSICNTLKTTELMARVGGTDKTNVAIVNRSMKLNIVYELQQSDFIHSIPFFPGHIQNIFVSRY